MERPHFAAWEQPHFAALLGEQLQRASALVLGEAAERQAMEEAFLALCGTNVASCVCAWCGTVVPMLRMEQIR